METYVLQLGLDDETVPEGSDPWRQPVRALCEHHLYVPVPNAMKPYQRTRFFYGTLLRRYANRLRDVYRKAVEQWGKPDILHAHVSLPGGWLAADLGYEFSIPVIVQEHYSGFESDARFPWRLGCFIGKMEQRIQGFYAVSPGYARRIKSTGLVGECGVLPNPIDTDLFVPKRTRHTDHLRLVTTGSLGSIKGTDIFFEALRLLPKNISWTATFFGEVREQTRFFKMLEIPFFSGRVSLLGKVSQADLVSAYSQSDLFIVSSRTETANVSMLEAMACGIPVVTTRCGGPETLIDNSVGVAVKPNDPQSLANGILQVAQNYEHYNHHLLRQFVVDRYSKPVVAKMVIDAYKQALKQI